jgi:hypothetical protein
MNPPDLAEVSTDVIIAPMPKTTMLAARIRKLIAHTPCLHYRAASK